MEKRFPWSVTVIAAGEPLPALPSDAKAAVCVNRPEVDRPLGLAWAVPGEPTLKLAHYDPSSAHERALIEAMVLSIEYALAEDSPKLVPG